jgi:hypothetical protein
MGRITDGRSVGIGCDGVLVAVGLFPDPLAKGDVAPSSADEERHHREPTSYRIKEMNAYAIAGCTSTRLTFLCNGGLQRARSVRFGVDQLLAFQNRPAIKGLSRAGIISVQVRELLDFGRRNGCGMPEYNPDYVFAAGRGC